MHEKIQRVGQGMTAAAERVAQSFQKLGEAMQTDTSERFRLPDRLKFPPLGERFTPEQVVQQAIDAYIVSPHLAARGTLSEFICNELRLHFPDFNV
jgi:hypothetical protein